MGARVFIDGQEGTTGLSIRQRLAERDDIELVEIDERRRKHPAARRDCSRAADVCVLCLPDEAAREAAAWASEDGTRLLDASSAHRTDPGWVYGLPELVEGQRERIADSRAVCVPGCYATGALLLLRPLVDSGQLPASTPVGVFALSGYSGGGKSLISRWENPANALLELPYSAPYALDREHKHIPEIRHYSGLEKAPLFRPSVGPFRCGMRVEIGLHREALGGAGGAALWELLAERYAAEPFVEVAGFEDSLPRYYETRFDPLRCNGTNRIELHVLPNPGGHMLLVALLDNLGKGAGGAAVQNLNLMLGVEEERGLGPSSAP
ncbi:MAG: N-acetyl-gamma-glutamyl-phosphate reductase [Proteobacteria bacterium]|nr:N-acetyl-gamma-glutamyl-phosphate reductase [Pseudomonadota bacterium]